MIVKFWNDVRPLVPPEPGIKGVEMRVLIGEAEKAPNFIMRLFTVEPGGYSPYHSHPWEHEVFILSGKGEVHQRERTWEIGPGSVIYVPPGEEHQFLNVGKDVLQFICLVPRN